MLYFACKIYFILCTLSHHDVDDYISEQHSLHCSFKQYLLPYHPPHNFPYTNLEMYAEKGYSMIPMPFSPSICPVRV